MSHITPCGGRHAMPSAERYIPAEPGWRQPNPFFNLSSTIECGGPVTFPAFTGERIYMQPFLKTNDEVLLPSGLARWKPTVSAMLSGIHPSAKMFLMIDQSEVESGKSHRRPGPHIDGNWSEDKNAEFNPNELLILASDVEGCVAYLGDYQSSQVKEGGDCSSIDLGSMTRTRLKAGYAYVATVATIHESLPIKHTCQRTLVRINIPSS